MHVVRTQADQRQARHGLSSPPSPRPVLWRELVLGLATFGLYSLVAGLGGAARRDSALHHARDLLDVERWASIDIEGPMNRWLRDQDVLRVLANYEYAFTYLVSAFVLLAWLYVRRPDVYRWARTSFVTLNLLGIACFAAYPVTPPRLLPGSGFTDTVRNGHTFGSWGSSAVDHANSLAAMPSLHLAWALWVSVVLGFIASAIRVQLVSLIHVLVTLAVIMATANHYLLDAVGGLVCVVLAFPLAGLITPRPDAARRRLRLAPADAFFWYVDSDATPQWVGGLMHLDSSSADPPTRAEVVALVREGIVDLPRLRRRLDPASRWRRPQWVEVDPSDLDWDWHITEHVLPPDAVGEEGLDAFVAGLQSNRLPVDRPLWRLALVHGVAPGRWGAVFLMHHVLADGLLTVEHAVRLLLQPALDLARPAPEHPPGALARAAAVTKGLAQLATDGHASWRADGVQTASRAFLSIDLPLDEVLDVARKRRVRVTDVVLCLVASAVAQASRAPNDQSLRVSTTLLVPTGSGDQGNATGAAMVVLPLGEASAIERLAATTQATKRLRSGTRALAARFVMDRLCGLLPPPLHAWFARTVYGQRFFQAIASNMPGPVQPLTFAGRRLAAAFPVLPLAPGAPVAVGALGVSGRFGLGISLHPAFVSDLAAFRTALLTTYDELRGAAEGRPIRGDADSTLSAVRRDALGGR